MERLDNNTHGEGIQALFDRWDGYWASDIKTDIGEIKDAITEIVQDTTQEPQGDTTSEKKVKVQEVKKEESYMVTTSDGILYTLTSGIEGQKDSEITFVIDGETYSMESFGFSIKGGNHSVWIEPIDKDANMKTKTQLKKHTEKSHKNLKVAIDGMLRNIQRLLRSKDPKKQIYLEEIRKYKKEF